MRVAALMRCNVGKKLPLAVLFFLGIPGLHSQTSSAEPPRAAIFSGDAKDPAGGFIPNAIIRLESSDHSILTTKTDKEGHFAIEVPPGDYTLRVMAPGFTIYEHQSIHLAEGQPATENIVLQLSFCTLCVSVDGPAFETLNASLTSTIPLLPLPPLKLHKSPSR